MRHPVRAALAPLIAASTWRCWAYAVIGGALAMPFVMLGMVGFTTVSPEFGTLRLLPSFGVFCAVLPLIALTGFAVPAVRTLEIMIVGELLQVPADQLARGDRSVGNRLRTAGWFTLHLGGGAILSGITLALPPAAVVAIIAPFVPWSGSRLEQLTGSLGGATAWTSALAPVVGVASLVALVYLVVLVRNLVVRLLPWLLGPSPTERMTELERRTERLLERNRLARDLHDSVGHALSVVTMQASAAGRLVESDPAFARRALDAIEESARSALEELDQMLGVLREDAERVRRPARTLHQVGDLVRSNRSAGLNVEATLGAGLDAVAPTISREAFRVVQEGLTNALRHAGAGPVALELTVDATALDIAVRSPLPAPTPPARGRAGGRGLTGLRERVRLLGGTVSAGPVDREWVLSARLPVRLSERLDQPTADPWAAEPAGPTEEPE